MTSHPVDPTSFAIRPQVHLSGMSTGRRHFDLAVNAAVPSHHPARSMNLTSQPGHPCAATACCPRGSCAHGNFNGFTFTGMTDTCWAPTPPARSTRARLSDRAVTQVGTMEMAWSPQATWSCSPTGVIFRHRKDGELHVATCLSRSPKQWISATIVGDSARL